MNNPPERIKLPLKVIFSDAGQIGKDYGGLTRVLIILSYFVNFLEEFFSKLSEEILDPKYCLFEEVNESSPYVIVSPKSGVNSNHLEYFEFFGRFLGKSLLGYI
jgi:E3 ubiquitin-protein ligase NEDD4